MRRLELKQVRLTERARQQAARRKFRLGLSFEKADLALDEKTYITSEQAHTICQQMLARLMAVSGFEHECYRRGQLAFDSKTFMEDNGLLAKLPALFGVRWKQVRYHHLVRLGGDIERAGLGEYPKTTLLGSLLIYHDEQG